MQALQATAAAEAERKANSSKARIELEEQMKERQILQQQQQVCDVIQQLCLAHTCSMVSHCSGLQVCAWSLLVHMTVRPVLQNVASILRRQQ